MYEDTQMPTRKASLHWVLFILSWSVSLRVAIIIVSLADHPEAFRGPARLEV